MGTAAYFVWPWMTGLLSAGKVPARVNPTKALDKYSSVGSYPLFYVHKGHVLCAQCASEQDGNVQQEANWEDADLYCDECGERIESAYAE